MSERSQNSFPARCFACEAKPNRTGRRARNTTYGVPLAPHSLRILASHSAPKLSLAANSITVLETLNYEQLQQPFCLDSRGTPPEIIARCLFLMLVRRTVFP